MKQNHVYCISSDNACIMISNFNCESSLLKDILKHQTFLGGGGVCVICTCVSFLSKRYGYLIEQIWIPFSQKIFHAKSSARREMKMATRNAILNQLTLQANKTYQWITGKLLNALGMLLAINCEMSIGKLEYFQLVNQVIIWIS